MPRRARPAPANRSGTPPRFDSPMSRLASIPRKHHRGAADVARDDDEELPLAARLARLWAAQDRAGFCAIVIAEAMPQFCRIVSTGLNLQQSDAEDCAAEALEAFLDRPESVSVSNPYGYLARSAWNNGATVHRRRRRELVRSVEALSPSAGPDAADDLVQKSALVPDEWAVVAVEETLGEVEADASWATVVVEEALERLTGSQQALIRHLFALPFDFSRQDFDVRSQEAAAALGLKPEAFRKTKQRAYEALRKVIPQVVADLGVKPPTRFVAVFEETRGRFLANERDDEDG
jgi:RNA polymerase sigma factor (sigma-70 family)